MYNSTLDLFWGWYSCSLEIRFNCGLRPLAKQNRKLIDDATFKTK